MEPNESKKENDRIPIDAFGMVGIAWALASKDENKNSSFTQTYLENLIKKYENNEKGKRFFEEMIPKLYGVVAKLSYARENAMTSFNRLEDIKKIEYEGLEQITGIGKSVQGIITRLIGVVAGGSIGFIITPEDNMESLPVYSVLGITIGYSVMEIVLRIYKTITKKKMNQKYYNNKENNWDERFTLETHRASLLLYRDTENSLRRHYGIDVKKVRDKSKDWTKMAAMFLQKPNSKNSEISEIHRLIILSTKLEAIMKNFIFIKHKEDFKKFTKDKGENITDPNKRGLKGLATFLKYENTISEEIFNRIMEIREKRIRLFYDTDSEFGLPELEIWEDDEKKQNIVNRAEGLIEELENKLLKNEKNVKNSQ